MGGRIGIMLLAVIVLIAIAGLVLRSRRGDVKARELVDTVLRANGAARCLAAIELLRHLAGAGTNEIVTDWERVELPLLQALPDCPPDQKRVLRDALETCSKQCSQRDTAKRLMTMRDSLLA